MGFVPNHRDDNLLRLSEYLDGTLDPQARLALEKELATDAALRGELDALRAADELVRRHSPPIPEVNWDRFVLAARERREALEAAPAQPRLVLRPAPRVPWAWRSLAAAAILGLAVTATLMFRGERPSGEQRAIDNGGGEGGVTRVETMIAEVTVNRAGWSEGATRGTAIAVVTVSQRGPMSPMVTAAPPPRGRIMIVPVNDPEKDTLASFENEDADAFF